MLQEAKIYKKQLTKFLIIPTILIPFLIPLRLSLAYCILIPSLTCWLFLNFSELKRLTKENMIFQNLLVFICLATMSSFFGIDIFNSLRHLLALGFFAFTILFFKELSTSFKPETIILPLVCGQALAAFHTILEKGLSADFGRTAIGAVSESGQLALTIPLTVAYFYSQLKKNSHNKQTQILTILSLAFFAVIAFASDIGLAKPIFYLTILFSVFLIGFCIYNLFLNIFKDNTNLNLTYLAVLLPLLSIALIVNLKRGPWLGVILALTIFFTIFKRKLVIPLLLIIITVFLSVPTVSHRLRDSFSDFNISGGRNIMWKIGTELSTRYPLGIGFSNSKFQQQFAAEIPTEHQHFHNNFINILVECGWLPFVFFVYWLIQIVKSAFSRTINSVPANDCLKIGLVCTVISMMTAGFVEYNFGDSEVCILLFMLLGMLSKYCQPQ